jgi:hypothetical protein
VADGPPSLRHIRLSPPRLALRVQRQRRQQEAEVVAEEAVPCRSVTRIPVDPKPFAKASD